MGVNNRTQVGSENAKAVVKDDKPHPEEVTKTWYVFLPNVNNFKQVPNQTFRRATDNEKGADVRQTRIKVTGRTGYNRAMNGIYHRGDELHGGKSYYKHDTNDFTIRW